jgi:16S rRNA C967 or C1407 C5-methylase (RsmB/RsmF family)/NOL1/NOP2/fmu family ribosome biogenesis protein
MLTLPQGFVDRMKQQLGDEADAFFSILDTPSPTSIRHHHLKGKSPFHAEEKVRWCDHGYYLLERPFFHMDPHWHGGAYYVQEASSMIMDYILSQVSLPDHPRIFLDLCAAPGGKTGILAKQLRPCDVLVANEVVHQRRAVLRENLIKGGYLNTFISGEPASSFRDPFADLILIDAPCAGEGMMRKDPEAIRQWSPSLVHSCAVMQQQIVHHAIKGLKQDGILIYSTCSYSMEENMDNIRYFMDEYPLESVSISFPDEWGIQKLEQKEATGYQLYPHRIKGEGLFVAVLKNTGTNETPWFKPNKAPKLFEDLHGWLDDHLSNASDFRILKNSPTHQLISKEAEEKAIEVLTYLRGAELLAEAGERKGKDFIPSHFMAMAGLYDEGTGIIDVTLSDALDYLERSTTSLPQGKDPGWYIIRFEGTDLGWAKWTLQGWKNHYPMNWRLRDRRTK